MSETPTMTVSAADAVSAIITLAGRCDAAAAVDLRAQFAEGPARDARSLIVDLSAVDFIDSAGLAVLVAWRRLCRERGGSVTLIAPANPDAHRIFSLTQFDEVFRIVEPRGE